MADGVMVVATMPAVSRSVLGSEGVSIDGLLLVFGSFRMSMSCSGFNR